MAKSNDSASLREQFNISRLAIAYPWLTLGFWIAVTVAGFLAFTSLKYALFPDITFPVVVVNATGPFNTALDTEAKLTQPIEQQLQSLNGLDDIHSSSYPGQSAISVAFIVGTNLEESSHQVEKKLNQLTLPKGAAFKIIPLNLNESAAISYTIESSTQNLTELTKTARSQIVPAITNLTGVLKVILLGTNEADLGSQNNNNPPTAKSEIPPPNPQQPPTLVRFNGKEALAFQVIKRGNANTLDVVSEVEKAVGRLQSQLPNVRLHLAATQAEYIRQATQSTIDALIEAIVLSVIVIFPFLWNWRATFISALAIPTSLLGTFMIMASYGFNLETITLLALALVIGIIVDDAIVDVENITRHLELGEPPRQAAITATNEIGLTVTAATLTAVAVFMPIALMSGLIGQFFKPFGVTVSAALLISLLVSRTLSPVLAVFWLKQNPHQSAHQEGILGKNIAHIYRNLLQWSLNHKKIVIALAISSFIAGMGMIPLIPKGFIPKLDRGEFNIVYTAPLPTFAQQELSQDLSQSNSAEPDNSDIPPESAEDYLKSQIVMPNPLNDSLEVAKKLEDVVSKSPEVDKIFTIVGSREGEPNKGTLYIKLKSDRTRSTVAVQDQIRQQLPNLAGVNTSVEDIQFVDTGGQKPLQIALQGDDLKSLSQAAKDIKEQMKKLPGFADVTATGEENGKGNVFEIQHLNARRVAYVSANLSKDLSLGDATDQIVAQAKPILPPGVKLDLGSDSARIGEIFGSFGTTSALSVLSILVVLILLFKSLVDPLIIAFSLPLSLVGAMLALYLTKSDFGMISLIGFIFLLGLTNKNGILLVDYINQLRKTGLDCHEAILTAGPVRLRPIMMTTAATILGMVPIALGLGAGSELRSPMAVSIAGGLVTSTILSLFVIPVMYAVVDKIYPRFGKNQSSKSS